MSIFKEILKYLIGSKIDSNIDEYTLPEKIKIINDLNDIIKYGTPRENLKDAKIDWIYESMLQPSVGALQISEETKFQIKQKKEKDI